MTDQQYNNISKFIIQLIAVQIKNESILTTLLRLKSKEISEKENRKYDEVVKELDDLCLKIQDNCTKEFTKLILTSFSDHTDFVDQLLDILRDDQKKS